MPLYSYECKCGYSTEMIDSMTGNRLLECPACKENSLIRLIGAGAGFSFKSGFKDKAGQSIHFKEPYFDTALRRRFSSAREKSEFMNKNGIVEAGDSDVKVKRERKEHFEMKNDTKKKGG